MRKKIMLIIDDEKEIHDLIKEYLSPLNIEFYSAYSGEEGVKMYNELMAKNKKPDLVVMDLNLSGSRKFEDLINQIEGKKMDGVRTTEEILKIDKNANVVGFTAFAHLDWGKRLKSLGIKNVFGREIGFDGFAKKVNELLA
ncbi:MAG: response regulator [Thermoplasmatales archaeon]|nr:response regulator [Thermoplasmatales archaeon]